MSKGIKTFDIFPPRYKGKKRIIDLRAKKDSKSIFNWMILGIVFILTGTSIPVITGPEEIIDYNDIYKIVELSSAQPVFLPINGNIEKKIEINLSKQILILWRSEKKLAEYIVSTGKSSTPTKTGNFSVISKHPMAYGGVNGLYWTMPYFLGIYRIAGQENGIHELPFLNGYRESERSLGHPVSHGCVRLPIGSAEILYNWTEIGTPVAIHY